MGLLDSFEKGLERAVNSAFAKTFRSGIQPVEIASALRSELDKKAAVVSRDRILAPNTFTVRLSPADDEQHAHARRRARRRARHPRAEAREGAGLLVRRPGLDHARARRSARRPARSASSRPPPRAASRGAACSTSRASGIRSSKSRTVIGRGSDADITISDAGTSRKHVEILWDGERAMVRDMKSTNGTHAERPQGHRGGAARPTRPSRSAAPTSSSASSRRRAPPKPPMPADDATRAYDVRDGGPLP